MANIIANHVQVSGLFSRSALSEYVGFISDGRLRQVPVAGGPAQVVSTLPAGSPSSNAFLRLPTSYYGAWNQQGVILLSAPSDGPLLTVPASGGQLVPATELDAGRKERFHQYPSFLPDGRHYLFYAATTDAQNNAAFVATLDSKERRPLPGIASQVKYSPSGHLLFIRDGALMAQPFDVGRLESRERCGDGSSQAASRRDPASASRCALPRRRRRDARLRRSEPQRS